MVDTRGISPVSTLGFTDANSMANKMSEEKQGQGGEYFLMEGEAEEENKEQETFQDRSAQLRASLNGLAAANVGSIKFMEAVHKRAREEERKRRIRQENEPEQDEIYEIYEE